MTDADPNATRNALRALHAEFSAAYPEYAKRLVLLLRGDRVIVAGEVPSVEATMRIVERVRQLPGVRDVLDMLIVSAPLTPAHPWVLDQADRPDPDPDERLALGMGPGSDEGTRIARHPSITPQGRAIAGRPLRLTIDLAREPDDDTRAERMTLADLAGDWTAVPVRVEVFCADMTFERGANVGTVIVRRNQPSIPATVVGIVGDLGRGRDLIHVRAIFDRNDRHCGDAERAVEVEPKSPGDAMMPGRTRGWNEIDESLQPPDMTIRILSLRADDTYLWATSTHVAGGPAERSAKLKLGEQARSFGADLRRDAVLLEPGHHAGRLKSYGQRIWNLAPREFRELYWIVRRRLGADFSIQIVTDEPHVHWELMQPVDPDRREEADHVMLDHPVARWVSHAEGFQSQTLPSGVMTTFAPSYPDAGHQLPFAIAESRWLCTEFGAVPHDATRDDFQAVLSAISGEPVALLHFAGHGSFADGIGDGILMVDGWVNRMDVDNSDTTLGERDGTLVVLNACDVGNVGTSLGAMDGWATILAARRFRGFVGPLWRVTDMHASEVVRTFLTGLYRQRLPLGEAMRRGREVHAAASPTPFAYVCYGDVLARVR